jgi:hypothetical protein
MSKRSLSVDQVIQRASAPLVVGETVDLRDLVISEPLDLSGLRLGNVDFSGTCFQAPVTGAMTEFLGLAWFRNCRFDNLVRFDGAVLENDCRFDHAVFNGAATFSRCELRGAAAFDQCQFRHDLALQHSVLFGNLSLSSTHIHGCLDLRSSQCFGGIWLDRCVAAQGIRGDQAEVHGRLWLRNADVGPIDDLICFGYQYNNGSNRSL